MFKVGDKVRCIQGKSNYSSNFDLEQGGIYTVGSVHYVHKTLRFIENNETWGYKSERFVLAEESKQSSYNPIHHKIKQMEERF